MPGYFHDGNNNLMATTKSKSTLKEDSHKEPIQTQKSDIILDNKTNRVTKDKKTKSRLPFKPSFLPREINVDVEISVEILSKHGFQKDGKHGEIYGKTINSKKFKEIFGLTVSSLDVFPNSPCGGGASFLRYVISKNGLRWRVLAKQAPPSAYPDRKLPKDYPLWKFYSEKVTDNTLYVIHVCKVLKTPLNKGSNQKPMIFTDNYVTWKDFVPKKVIENNDLFSPETQKQIKSQSPSFIWDRLIPEIARVSEKNSFPLKSVPKECQQEFEDMFQKTLRKQWQPENYKDCITAYKDIEIFHNKQEPTAFMIDLLLVSYEVQKHRIYFYNVPFGEDDDLYNLRIHLPETKKIDQSNVKSFVLKLIEKFLNTDKSTVDLTQFSQRGKTSIFAGEFSVTKKGCAPKKYAFMTDGSFLIVTIWPDLPKKPRNPHPYPGNARYPDHF